MSNESTPNDYRPLIQTLSDAGLPYFIEGGQAVNIWAECFFSDEMEKYSPFTSKDCDIWIGPETFKQIKKGLLQDGRLRLSESPLDGQLAIFETNENPTKVLDLMQGVFGIPSDQINRAYERSLEIQGIQILDPLFLFKGKCHNLVGLNQANRQDEKHVNLLCLIVPAYFEHLLEEAELGNLSESELKKDLKMFRKYQKDRRIKKALTLVKKEIDDLIPIQLFKHCSLPKLKQFAEQSWPS